MKKIIMAIDNNKLLKKIKNKNDIEIINDNLQYREAILEILEKINNIDYILISENIPGEISIEKLIKKIKLKNKKIEIIVFLEKQNIEKENILKKLNIKNIYYNNKMEFKKINNNKINNKINDKLNNKLNIKIINKLIIKNKIKKMDNKIITISGEKNSGKTTITFLFILYLLNKNNKILLINLNRKIEKEYLILLENKYFKNKEKILNKNNKKNNIENLKININKNLIFLNKFQDYFYFEKNKNKLKQFLIENKKLYNYILIDIGEKNNKILKNIIIKNSDKNIIVYNKKIMEIKKLINETEKIKKENLYIIKNKHYFNSISLLIFKYIFKINKNMYIIYNNKNYKNLSQKIYKKDLMKINLITKYKLKKIIK